jgi:hypothetical protein
MPEVEAEARKEQKEFRDGHTGDNSMLPSSFNILGGPHGSNHIKT